MWALFWSINPINFEYFGRLFYLFLYLLSIFSIVDLLNNKNLKLILFIALSLITFNYNHFTGNQDILVFSLVIFLSRYLYLIHEKKEQTLFNFILFILINNIILWIKYECIVYVILSYSILLIYKLLKKDYKFAEVDNFLKINNFRKDFKTKMFFRKTFEYIYSNNQLN